MSLDRKRGALSKLSSTHIMDTFSSGISKSIDFVKNYTKNILEGNLFRDGNGTGFLKSLNDSKITPNNVVAFRLFSFLIGVIFYYILNPWLGISMMTLSAGLDGADGALARKYNLKSKVGEIYDAGTDKISELGISVTAISALNNNILSLINTLILVGKAKYHSDSQFKEGRPSPEEQLDMFTQATFMDEETQSIEQTTSGAANKYGKIKTIVQLSAGIGMLVNTEFFSGTELGRNINSEYFNNIAEDLINVILTVANGTSLILAQKSISGKKS